MLTQHFAVLIFSVGVAVPSASIVSAQNYPNKPIRVVTNEAGGSTDFIARIAAQGMSEPLGQPIIIENRPSGVVGEIAAKALPDGYSLLVAANALWIAPLVEKKSYDAIRDFAPITTLASLPNILVVHPSVAATSAKELIALARAKSGTLNYASGLAGTSTHLSGELFNSMAGVKIVGIPYKGGAAAVNDLLGGHVQLMFASAASVAPHIKSGKLRALAVTSAEPSVLFPGLPAVAASGLPGYEVVTLYCLFAPAKTPTPIVDRLNREVGRVISRKDVIEKLLNSGAEPVASSPAQLAAKVKGDVVRWGKVLKELGLRPE